MKGNEVMERMVILEERDKLEVVITNKEFQKGY